MLLDYWTLNIAVRQSTIRAVKLNNERTLDKSGSRVFFFLPRSKKPALSFARLGCPWPRSRDRQEGRCGNCELLGLIFPWPGPLATTNPRQPPPAPTEGPPHVLLVRPFLPHLSRRPRNAEVTLGQGHWEGFGRGSMCVLPKVADGLAVFASQLMHIVGRKPLRGPNSRTVSLFALSKLNNPLLGGPRGLFVACRVVLVSPFLVKFISSKVRAPHFSFSRDQSPSRSRNVTSGAAVGHSKLTQREVHGTPRGRPNLPLQQPGALGLPTTPARAGGYPPSPPPFVSSSSGGFNVWYVAPSEWSGLSSLSGGLGCLGFGFGFGLGLGEGGRALP